MTLQKIALVQCFIHHVKGCEVDIAIPKNGKEKDLLNRAYNDARLYFL